MQDSVIRHRATLPPVQCHRCKKIFYGSYSDDRDRIVPRGYLLCLRCYVQMESHFRYHPDFIAVHSHQTGTEEWKDAYPDFFNAVTEWIASSTPKAVKYSRVPKWVRSAIETGKMVPNDDHVYYVSTQGNSVVMIDRTRDRSGLQHWKITKFRQS
jgi:hypothetical protein